MLTRLHGRLAAALLLAALCNWAAPADATVEEVLKAPVPGWVVTQQVPEPNEARLHQVEDGLYYLLYDRQYRQAGPDTTELYRRVAVKVVERAGLEDAASVTWTFDPSNEQLIVHAIRIRRGDEVIDLTDQAEFIVVRRETDLERGMLDGNLTAHADLMDVRVGDIIDTEITYRTRDKVAKGHLATGFKPFFSFPVGRLHFRALWPKDRPLDLRMIRTEAQPDITETADTRAYVWAFRDQEPRRFEAETPSWSRHWGGIWLSSMTSWGEVVDDFLPHYDIAGMALPAGFAAEIDQIAAATDDPALRIALTLRLVQDRIRYVGIEIGRGAFIARSPATVVERGFGDCKDKAVLLSAALRRLGIDAVPALAHLERGRGLSDLPPTPYAFDHMIVQARVGDRVWWLDPTFSYQGGDGTNLVPPDYGNALPLRPGQTALEAIPDPILPDPNAVSVEVFDFAGPDGDVSLEVTTVNLDGEAEAMRRHLAGTADSSVSRGYLEYYQGQYPGIREARALEVEDDRDANRLTVREYYRIPKADFDLPALRENFAMYGVTLTNLLRKPSTSDRTMPVFQTHPLHRRHKVEFRNPPIALSPPDPFRFDGRYFAVTTETSEERNGIAVEWSMRTKAHEVPAADAAEYVADIGRFEKAVNWTYDLTVPAAAEAKPEESRLIQFLRRVLE